MVEPKKKPGKRKDVVSIFKVQIGDKIEYFGPWSPLLHQAAIKRIVGGDEFEKHDYYLSSDDHGDAFGVSRIIEQTSREIGTTSLFKVNVPPEKLIETIEELRKLCPGKDAR